MNTSARDLLQSLVPCERYRGRFSTGLPVSGCLRRQLERLPGAKRGTVGPPKFPACAVCLQGTEVAARAAEAGITRGTCPTCGAALIGDAACEVCMDTKAPARGFLPVGVEKSERIWSGEVPDVPIGRPPAALTPGEEAAAATARRVREAAPRVAPARVEPPSRHDVAISGSKAHHEPARPAEEEAMAGKTCSKCGKDLRADNTAGICGDQTGCRARVAAKAGKPALPPRPARAVERPRKLVGAAKHVGLENMTVPELLALVDQAKAELRRRRDEAAANLRAIEKEIGDALGEAA